MAKTAIEAISSLILFRSSAADLFRAADDVFLLAPVLLLLLRLFAINFLADFSCISISYEQSSVCYNVASWCIISMYVIYQFIPVGGIT
jgi:hypothetical protein